MLAQRACKARPLIENPLASADVTSRMLAPLAAGTADIYARACGGLLPTPSRSHYVFSLRDVGRVLQVRIKRRLLSVV